MKIVDLLGGKAEYYLNHTCKTIDKQLIIHVPYADSFVVHANVWKASVGRIPLYLLDTDNELNSEFDLSLIHISRLSDSERQTSVCIRN